MHLPWDAAAPLTPRVRTDIVRLCEAKIDYMPGLSRGQKKNAP